MRCGLCRRLECQHPRERATGLGAEVLAWCAGAPAVGRRHYRSGPVKSSHSVRAEPFDGLSTGLSKPVQPFDKLRVNGSYIKGQNQLDTQKVGEYARWVRDCVTALPHYRVTELPSYRVTGLPRHRTIGSSGSSLWSAESAERGKCCTRREETTSMACNRPSS